MNIGKFCREKAIIELILFVGYVGGIVYLWHGRPSTQEPIDLKRSMGANAIASAVTGSLTVAGLFLSAALIALRGDQPLSLESKNHIRWAVSFALISLLAGAFALAYVPARVAKYDVTGDVAIAVSGAVQLLTMLMAGARILFAILRITK